ncbi:MAG: HpcH/HpaI aldolase/citrate lyase family protein [Lachnospiraceae bacterium]|nr:HpcH/HpaI aldolase/citrate lyase family protein [Lachnospiraceae bacterium]MDE6233746.1 HpcH/HpaI aldolase/citrate lyase family protein [Lachnospiraceae bacterium]MDE6251512.1 HpcH/HpaI aldolase/citrate lyase family protein [Lachnospiraceae bacterium]
MKNSVIHYSVGALLYCPANNESIVNSIINGKFGSHFSVAMCLEDTIKDEYVEEAENKLINTIQKLYNAKAIREFFLPKIFIRVRNPQQITDLYERFQESRDLITGFIIPKFSLENADKYIDMVRKVNNGSKNIVYMMPIFESPDIINLRNRYDILYKLKQKLDTIEDIVLNIRVGGNDLCHIFGFRRHSDESIHSLKAISGIFSDIITVFGADYVISGPVWEYYNGDNWDTGLIKELKDDRLSGFVGKTVIHPKQIELVNNAYKVSQKDLDDAKSILNWDSYSHSLVSGSVSRERMNEYKTHSNWALKTILLAEAFGINTDTP